MKFDWTIPIDSEKSILPFSNKKVGNVSESRNGNMITWRGELDNGVYFILSFIGGSIIASFDERELKLLINDPITVCCESRIKKMPQKTDIITMMTDLITGHSSTNDVLISEIVQSIKFQDIMEIFNWSFLSDKEQIYEYNKYF